MLRMSWLTTGSPTRPTKGGHPRHGFKRQSGPYGHYRGKLARIYFRADAGFANPRVYQYIEGEGIKPPSGCQPTAFCRSGSPICSSALSAARPLDVRRSYARSQGPAPPGDELAAGRSGSRHKRR
jgi:hypothetical protein